MGCACIKATQGKIIYCIQVKLFAGGSHDIRRASDCFIEEKYSYSFQTSVPAFMSSSVLPLLCGTSSHGWVALIFLPPTCYYFCIYCDRTVQCSKKCRRGKTQLANEVTCCTNKYQIWNGLFIWLGIPNKFIVPRESAELKLKVRMLDEQVPNDSIYEQR